MPLKTQQIVDAIRVAGLTEFTARQLERLANLGAIPHPARRGKGRGRGWECFWNDEALPIALYIADAMKWQPRRRLEDAVLWARLRGAPISVSVIREFLGASFQRMAKEVPSQASEDARLDWIEEKIGSLSYRSPLLRSSGLSVKDRNYILQETFGHLSGDVWPGRDSRQVTDAYERAWKSKLAPLGIPWATDPTEVRAQQRFFNYHYLAKLVQNLSDDELLSACETFAEDYYFVGIVLEQHAAGQRITKRVLKRARKLKKILDALFKLDPAWVWLLYLYPLLDKERSLKSAG